MKNKITVDDKLIEDLSRLAKLKFDKNSSQKMKDDLSIILGFVDALSEVETDGIEPLIYMSEELNALREDNIANEVSQKKALKNAPQKDSDYFKVPTVLRKKL
jgi:aspartyl-tRNA(Asn)/glutamyl-tRNA(Gln) amidotransferase subunit C